MRIRSLRAAVTDAVRIALYMSRRRRFVISGRTRITTCSAWYGLKSGRVV